MEPEAYPASTTEGLAVAPSMGPALAAARVPVRRLTSVDFPTFGNPTTATVPASSPGIALPQTAGARSRTMRSMRSTTSSTVRSVVSISSASAAGCMRSASF